MNTSPSPADPSRPGRWRAARRLLVSLGTAATLIAIFYTVENWRGQRAWEKCRRELEAKGQVLDWAAYIPAPVPNDRNFFKAPEMREWFVKESSLNSGTTPGTALVNASNPFTLPARKNANLVVAEVRISVFNASTDSPPADPVLRFDDPAARAQAAKLLGAAIGPCALGSKQCVLVAQPLDQFKPLHLVLKADTVPTVKELAAFFPASPLTNLGLAYSGSSYLQVDLAGSNTFRVSLKEPVYGAGDYLAWTEPLTVDFDLARKALERPYARIDCDYEQPFLMPIPNFVNLRDAAQILSQRAQSHLLLGQPEAASQELALVHDLCRILMAEPAGKPITLVAAMINVAVSGLYAGVVEDGLRLHAWREPQLQVLERQLKETDLLSPVVEAFREEWAAVGRTFETTSRPELVKLFGFGGLMSKLVVWMPRGWLYQNLAVGAETRQELLGSVDPTNRLVRPSLVSQVVRRTLLKSAQRSPYTFLVSKDQPNYAKAVQTMARNQTLVNQAWVACGLERYRLVQGQYPETLDALVPRFLERVPQDLIGGQPLRYQRGGDGGCRLYSLGWDGKDDGGVPGNSIEEGDWVWVVH